jgi:lipopolysaccharide transport system permease protein/teichoic acid transport system permease protein
LLVSSTDLPKSDVASLPAAIPSPRAGGLVRRLLRDTFPHEIYATRGMLWSLVKRDFKSRYAGSMLGLVWAFLQPLAMMLILSFVFIYGLKARPVAGPPFAAWFFSASVAWNFVSDGIVVAGNAILEYAFLVKKVNFRVRLLPLVKVLSALILHLVFLVVLVAILLWQRIYPTIYWLQVVYYLAGAVALLVGLGWLTAALNVFTRDIGQLIGIALQFGFWVTPIVWDIHALDPKYQRLLKLNPAFYLTEGYRNSFVYGRSIAEHGWLSALYFWGFTAAVLAVGHIVFKRLRPHFGDVL